jgi:hypothetical protein
MPTDESQTKIPQSELGNTVQGLVDDDNANRVWCTKQPDGTWKVTYHSDD